MIYQEAYPCARLAAYVDKYWTADPCGESLYRDSEMYLPDGRADLIFNFGGKFTELTPAGRAMDHKGSSVWFQRQMQCNLSGMHATSFFAVKFRPGGINALFNLHANEMTNSALHISDLSSDLIYIEEILAEKLFAERVAVIESYLLKFVSEQKKGFDEMRCITEMMIRSSGSLHIMDMLRDKGLSYKKAERLFDRYVGLTPKIFSKVVRFGNAVNLMYERPESSLTSITYSLDYFDQAHFIRDFRLFTALTPGQFLASRFLIPYALRPIASVSNKYNRQAAV